MANPHHKSKLLEGVTSWNEWRRKNPDLYPDLSNITLNNLDLSGVWLAGANLERVRIGWCNLSNASLFRASLSGAVVNNSNLRDVNMKDLWGDGEWGGCGFIQRCDLSGVNLEGAFLRGSVFRDVDLANTNLSDTYLQKADLSKAVLDGANLVGARYCSYTEFPPNFDAIGAGMHMTSCHDNTPFVDTRALFDKYAKQDLVRQKFQELLAKYPIPDELRGYFSGSDLYDEASKVQNKFTELLNRPFEELAVDPIFDEYRELVRQTPSQGSETNGLGRSVGSSLRGLSSYDRDFLECVIKHAATEAIFALFVSKLGEIPADDSTVLEKLIEWGALLVGLDPFIFGRALKLASLGKTIFGVFLGCQANPKEWETPWPG